MRMVMASPVDAAMTAPAAAHDAFSRVSGSMALAAAEKDFGGYIGPAVGLLTIFALILVLSPPLRD